MQRWNWRRLGGSGWWSLGGPWGGGLGPQKNRGVESLIFLPLAGQATPKALPGSLLLKKRQERRSEHEEKREAQASEQVGVF